MPKCQHFIGDEVHDSKLNLTTQIIQVFYELQVEACFAFYKNNHCLLQAVYFLVYAIVKLLYLYDHFEVYYCKNMIYCSYDKSYPILMMLQLLEDNHYHSQYLLIKLTEYFQIVDPSSLTFYVISNICKVLFINMF